MRRAVADHREIVRDVLGEIWGTSRCSPAYGVYARAQWLHEEVVSLLSTWAQDQLGYRGFVSDQIARRQLHIEERRLAARGTRKELRWMRNLKAIDRHCDLRRLRAAPGRAHKLFGPGLWRVVETRPVTQVDEREEQ